MNIRASIIISIALLFTVSCAPKPKSEVLAINHLELLKSGKTAEANQQYCSIEDPLLLNSISSYKITNSRPSISDGAQMTDYIVEVETSQTNPRLKSNPVEINIVKSEDFYAVIVKSNEAFNKKMTDALAPIGRSHTPLEPPKRESINSAELCIFLSPEQFEVEKTDMEKETDQINEATDELQKMREEIQKGRQSP